MLKFLKKKPKPKAPPELLDVDGNIINENDIVESLRYDMGKCRVELEGLQYFYVSIETGQKVSYVKMIDAITEQQKVKKVN